MKLIHRPMGLLHRPLGGLGSPVKWEEVSAPSGWTWSLPFTIQQNGSNFRVDPSFSLQTYAGISVTTTYYVKTDGNDANDGLSEANALKRLAIALSKADVDRIYIKAGTYYLTDGWNNISPNRDVEVIGYGGTVIISHQVTGLSWAVDPTYTNCYKASVTGTTCNCVTDGSLPDSDGDQVTLVRQADLATVNANPGSFLQSGTDMYVRTSDDREPDSDIYVYDGAKQLGSHDDPVKYYVEGLDFHGGLKPWVSTEGTPGAKLYMKNCTFKYSARNSTREGIQIVDCDEIILQNCVAARNGGDGFKAEYASISSKMALIDCVSRYNGRTTDNASNGYSRHGPGSTLLLNCEMHNNYGRTMHDINNGTLAWALGCNFHDPLGATKTNYAIGGTGSKLWLDTCISSGATTADIESTDAGTTVYYRDMTPASPTSTGSGTVTTY